MSLGKLLLFGTLLGLANVIGGLLVASSARHQPPEKSLKYLIALGAGFMLAAIFIEIMPEAIRIWSTETPDQAAARRGDVVDATTLLLMGYLLIHLFEHTIAPHFHFGAETHPEAMFNSTAAYTAIGGLTIHTLFDGVSIAAAFLADYKMGLLVFIAVLLHKVPEGFTAASIMLASGRSRTAARFATVIVGGATLAGVLVVAVLANRVEAVVLYALPFSAGVTLYVAASDLIPEINRKHERNFSTSLTVFGGVALFYALHRLLEP